MAEDLRTFETDQPWVIYRYGLNHDLWWPFWTSTRVLGYARIEVTCAVCGAVEIQKVKMPRFGPVPDRGYHPKRQAFLEAHAHPDRGAPMSWALPLLNPTVGIDLDALAMRLEADLNNPEGA